MCLLHSYHALLFLLCYLLFSIQFFAPLPHKWLPIVIVNNSSQPMNIQYLSTISFASKMGWRLGLQAVTGLVSCCFFMGILYRPASLYHPQRRAILHLKNQRKKVKEKKTHIQTPKPPFLDFTPFRSSTVRMFIAVTSTATLGIYAPIFFLVSSNTDGGVLCAQFLDEG